MVLEGRLSAMLQVRERSGNSLAFAREGRSFSKLRSFLSLFVVLAFFNTSFGVREDVEKPSFPALPNFVLPAKWLAVRVKKVRARVLLCSSLFSVGHG